MNSSIDIEIGSSNSVEYEIGKNKYTSSYNTLTDKPSINGVELVGNKTTEELGIDIDTSNFVTKDNAVKTFDIEYTYGEEDYYTANAIHQLLELFVEEITSIQKYVTTRTYEVKYDLYLPTMSIKNVSSYSESIIKAHNEGKTVVFIGNVLGTNIKINIYLNIIDGTYAFTYPVMRVDIGDGLGTYLYYQ